MHRVRNWFRFAWIAGCLIASPGCSTSKPETVSESVVVFSLIDRLSSATIVAEQGELEMIEARRIVAGGEERIAILTHTPSEFSFPIIVPPGAFLRTGVGLSDLELNAFQQADGVQLSIWIADGDSVPRSVWSQELLGTPAGWTDISVSLEPWAGKTIQLGFRAEPRGNLAGDYAAWSRPVIATSVRSGPSSVVAQPLSLPSTLWALRIEQDLLEHPGLVTTGCSAKIPGVVVPPNGAIDFAIQALRDPAGEGGALGPVRVELTLDGKSVYRRVAGSFGSAVTLPGRIDLAAFAGRTMEIGFDVCDERVGNSLIWSKRLWLGSFVETPRQTAKDGWNLLVLLVDTVRADHVGHYGYERPTTPNWDELTASAQVFDQVSAPASWTQPSITTLFTGLSPIEHGVIEGVPLPIRTLTLPEILQREGFTTLGVSSNPIIGALEGFHRGFENFVQAPWIRADQINDVFFDWLDQAEEQRWFAYLHYIDPHTPYEAPGAYSQAFTDGCRTEWSSEAGMYRLSESINFGHGTAEHTPADIDCLSDLYDGEILYWDSQLGRLLEELRNRGQFERTLIVVTSDHGEEFMEHGRILHGYDLYQETVHVPLTIRRPDTTGPTRVSAPVAAQGLNETLFHLLGVRRPGDGDELPRLLAPDREEPIFAHTTESWMMGTGFTPLASIREADWKCIYRPEDGKVELFDLAADPMERSELAAERADKTRELKKKLSAWLAGAKAHTFQTRGLDDETVEKLKSLGYVK